MSGPERHATVAGYGSDRERSVSARWPVPPYRVDVLAHGRQYVLSHAGRVLRDAPRNGALDGVILELERSLRIMAEGRTRPCLTCGAAFESEGPHNRMCKTCRGRG